MFRYSWKTFGFESIFVLLALVFAIPFFVLVALSLKTTMAMLTEAPLSFDARPTLANFGTAWEEGMARAMLDSVIVTTVTVFVLIVLGSITAYWLARHDSRISGAIYVLFLLGIIIPTQLSVVPLFVVFRQLGLTGSLVGMTIFYIGLLTPFTVFLYAGFIRALPRDYEEAARVDGASFRRMFFKVVLPLLRPITGTVAILAGMIVWNDLFFALVFLSGSDHQTLPVAIYEFVDTHLSQWNLIFAAVLISIAPILLLFLFAQRQMIRGFAGGVRG